MVWPKVSKDTVGRCGRTVLAEIVLLVVVCSVLSLSCKENEKEGETNNTVNLQENGTLRQAQGGAPDLLDLIKSSLESVDDAYDLIVTPELIAELRDSVDFMELDFKVPLEYNLWGKKIIKLHRILIPLEGKFAANDQVTLFCGFPEYSSGPYVKFKFLGILKKKIEETDWSQIKKTE